MNVVDSSGWLEFLGDGPNAGFFAGAINDHEHLVVPTICVFEVYKRVLALYSHAEAQSVVSAMEKGLVVEFDLELSTHAAQLSVELSLPLADSVILATARAYEATLWTQDADFDGMAGVRYAPHGG